MSTHPWAYHEVARLRHEERIVKARAYHTRVADAEPAATSGRRRALDGLFRVPRFRAGLRRGFAVRREARLLS